MEQNNSVEKNSIKARADMTLKKAGKFFARWFFMLSLLAAASFCVFVWYNYIWNANWDEAKKQSYISEQAKFSFDKTGYKKMVDMMKNRKIKLENFPSFTGRDIFFPEGF